MIYNYEAIISYQIVVKDSFDLPFSLLDPFTNVEET